MKGKAAIDLIQIDPSLTTPVYKQIVQSISRNIDNGILNKDDMLPSVNQIAAEFSLARGSVFTAYNELRSSGIIDSIPGKGYFVLSTETRQKKKIFLLFSTFTPYKEILYNALLNNLPETCALDIYFHHHSMRMFETLIREQSAYYNTYVIMPEVNDNTLGILSKLDLKHTFLLDVGLREYRENYPGVYQNFEKDIFSILMDSEQLVRKYKRLFLIFPDGSRTRDIISGFQKFGRKKIIATELKSGVGAGDIQKGDAFIIIDDNNLVDVIHAAREKGWQLGKDIGVISYNESPLKSVVGNGITTITTDFVAMGKTMAEMVVSGKREVVENPFVMIDRKSF
ncbi:MAG: GntR family transcriptional regulator [Bacteroidetes bacterium]|nr:GntR family transcriptional regulator [Bacteroidota bacterium]